MDNEAFLAHKFRDETHATSYVVRLEILNHFEVKFELW